MHPLEDPQLIRPRIFGARGPVVAAFSTRIGGVSGSPFDSLNLGEKTRDLSENVERNRERLLEALGFPPDHAALAGQVHGARVVRVEQPGLVPECDGLVTDKEGIVLCIQTADCAAVLLADVDANVVGACHAGWRGAVGGVVEATIGEMKALRARPHRLHAYISPCISARRFEVGPEVAERFDPAHVHHDEQTQKPHVDLRGHIVSVLESYGVRGERIEASSDCTVEDRARFYSYRRDGAASGRMMGVIGIRP